MFCSKNPFPQTTTIRGRGVLKNKESLTMSLSKVVYYARSDYKKDKRVGRHSCFGKVSSHNHYKDILLCSVGSLILPGSNKHGSGFKFSGYVNRNFVFTLYSQRESSLALHGSFKCLKHAAWYRIVVTHVEGRKKPKMALEIWLLCRAWVTCLFLLCQFSVPISSFTRSVKPQNVMIQLAKRQVGEEKNILRDFCFKSNVG